MIRDALDIGFVSDELICDTGSVREGGDTGRIRDIWSTSDANMAAQQ